MKIWVTGGSGFIGGRVVRQLCSEHKVTCLLRKASDTSRIDELDFSTSCGDILNPESLRNSCQDHDIGLHLASVSAWSDITGPDVESIIIEGTQNVIDACRQSGTRRLVYVSSAAAINGSCQPRVFNEESPYEIDGLGMRYADSKHEAEQRVLAANDNQLETVVVNPAETYGAQDTGMVTAGAIAELMRSWPVFVVSGGTSVVHVDDVADGIIRAMNRGKPGSRYILGGDNLSVCELVQLALDAAGTKRPIVTVPRRLLTLASHLATRLGVNFSLPPGIIPYASRYWFMDSSKAQRELGYCSRPAQETISEVVEWLQSTRSRDATEVQGLNSGSD